MSSDASPLQSLLRHESFVRAVARELLRDEPSVDDVVQQTWLAALDAAPREDRSLLPWLAVVARRFAWRARLRESRRAARERVAARREAIPSPEEIRARAETSRRVTEAVLALEPPLRDALVLRFLEGLEPRQIAERLGLPPETVKTRLKRGKERLRAALEAELGGGGAWCAALLPLATAPLPSVGLPSTIGLLAVTTKTKALLAAACVLVAIWLVWTSLPPVAPPPERGSLSEGALSSAAAVEGGAAASATQVVAETQAIADRKRSESPIASFGGTLVIQLLWHDGTPAAGAPLRIVPWNAPNPVSQSRRSVTDVEGEARFEGVPPGEVKIQVDGRSERSAAIARDKTTELRIQLAAGTDLDGTVVDQAGNVVSGAEIHATRWMRPAEPPALAVSDASGRFSLRGLMAGQYLSAYKTGWSPSDALEVPATSSAPLVLVLQGRGGAVSGVVTDLAGTPIPGAAVLVGDQQLFWGSFAPGRIPPRSRRVVCDASGRFYVGGVAPGNTCISARAPGFALTRSGVRVALGEEAKIMFPLKPAARVAGRVTSSDGNAVGNAIISTGRLDEFQLESNVEFFGGWTRSAADGTFIIDGLDAIADPVAFSARGPSGGTAATSILLDTHGKEFRWDPVLSDVRSLTVKIISLAGTRTGGWELTAWAVEEAGAPDSGAAAAVSAKTNDRGEAELRGLSAARYYLAGTNPRIFKPFGHVDLGVVDSRAGSVEIAIPDHEEGSAALVARVVDRSGAPVLDAALELSGMATRAQVPVDRSTGRARVGPIPPGGYVVSVTAPGRSKVTLPHHVIRDGEEWNLGDITLIGSGSLRLLVERDAEVEREFAEVHLHAAGTEWSASQPLHAREIRLEGVPVGRVDLRVFGAACAAEGTSVEIAEGVEAMATVKIHKGVLQKLRLESGSPERPLQHPLLRILREGDICVREAHIVPEEGEHTLQTKVRLVPGNYRVLWRDDGREAESALVVGGVAAEGQELATKLP